VDVGLTSRHGGENYGWNVREGSLCYLPPNGCPTAGFVPPVLEYDHSQGCSIIGGPLYRGCRMPELAGTYFYGDYCSAFVRSFRLQGGQAVEQRDWTATLGVSLGSISSFGTDADGEIYVVDQTGRVYQLVPAG
jgi:glucose/arabinose dehydrogenase